jgi:FkbM family methyltransferase
MEIPQISLLAQVLVLSLLLNLFFILSIPRPQTHISSTQTQTLHRKLRSATLRRHKAPRGNRNPPPQATVRVHLDPLPPLPPLPFIDQDGRISRTPLNPPKDLSPTQRTQTLLNIRTSRRRIFIDIGANDGGSTSFFLDPDNKLILSTDISDISSQGGRKDSFIRGLGAKGDWEVVVVEPNFYYTPLLLELREKALKSNLARVFTVHNGTAVSSRGGNITFIYDNNVTHADAGATTMAESYSAVGPHFTLPAVTLYELFRLHKIRKSDFVVLKVDVEGAEYDLLKSAVLDRLQGRVDLLAVEWHENNTWVFGRDRYTQITYITCHNRILYNRILTSLPLLPSSPYDCMTCRLNREVSSKYQRRHECLEWMLEDAGTGMQWLSWI